MNCSHFNRSILKPVRATLWLFTITVALLLVTSTQSIALKATSSLSGRVLDLKGNPVSGFRLTLVPVPSQTPESVSDAWLQRMMTLMSSRKSGTDEMGRFSVRNIAPVKVRVETDYKSRTDHESATG